MKTVRELEKQIEKTVLEIIRQDSQALKALPIERR